MSTQEFNLGIKAKICIITTILYPTILTAIILFNDNISIFAQAGCLIATMIMSYILAVLIQDYIFVKKHSDKSKCRHDVQFIAPLFERHDW